jgi:hypothetical protein
MSSGITFALLTALSMLLPAMRGWNCLPSDAAHQARVRKQGEQETQRPGYAGDDACKSCHREQSVTFAATAHHLTSQLPNAASVLGSFKEGSNVLTISRPGGDGAPGVDYRMEKKASGYYETAMTESAGRTETRSERIGIVIGSGVRGQSYLYWRGDELYELPVSYWSDGRQWINSPGFGNGPPIFDRPASPRCLECHVTYLEPLSPDPAENRYDRVTLVTGISCEVCHGPGAKHAALHRNGVHASSSGEMILNPARFSRDRQVDMCALCHNGAQQTRMGEAFSYTPGEPLDEYLGANPADAAPRPDVHANQVGLLKRSRCYIGSAKMSCSTCHDVHAPEQTAASYSSRCLSCHRVESCGMEEKMGAKIAGNCIDCHMPVLQTNAIVSETAEKTIRTRMRTHWIKVYSEAERQ